MRKLFLLFILGLFIFSGCDYQGSYAFKVKNATEETITLIFLNESRSDFARLHEHENVEKIVLLPSEEKLVRVVDGGLNSRSHDCLTNHGIAYFTELVFDTYVNEERLEKQIWQAENLTFRETSKWSGEYKMTITNDMIKR